MTDLGIHGRVDPELLAGIAAYQQGMQGAGAASEAAGARARQTGDSWGALSDRVSNGAIAFNAVVQSAQTIVGTLSRMAERVGDLATEQARLTSMSQRLGLDFDQAAAAAGRFADETEAMGVAGRFAAADIRLTQTELDAMMRVAGAASETLGTDTAGAVQQLQEALIRGREGGLQRFGEGLANVAGSSHTLQERLNALVVQAGHTVAATDTATDRMRRFKDSLEDAQRVAASAFVSETVRIQAFGAAADSASTDVDELKQNMQALGETGAYVINQVGNLAGVIVGAIAATLAPVINGVRVAWAIASNPRALLPGGGGAGLMADIQRIQEDNASVNSFTADRVRGLMNGGRALDERTTADPGASSAMTAQQREANRTARGGATAPESNGFGGSAGLVVPAASPAPGAPAGGHSVFATRAQLIAQAREHDNALIAQEAHEKAAVSAQLQRRIAAGAGAEHTLQAAAEARRASHVAFELKQAHEEEIFQRMLTEARTAANDNADAGPSEGKLAAQASMDAHERAAQVARSEKDTLDASIAAHESYTGRLAELNNERMHGMQRAAEFTNGAFETMGKAIGTHVQALIDGKESVGQALQGMLADTLINVGKEAIIQGGIETAKGIAALAGVATAPLAPGHFAAAGAFFAVGAAAGIAGAAIAPAAPAAGAGAGRGGAGGLLPDRAAPSSDNMAPINITYNAPVFGGREGTDAEVGTRLDRYDDAARARRRRAA